VNGARNYFSGIQFPPIKANPKISMTSVPFTIVVLSPMMMPNMVFLLALNQFVTFSNAFTIDGQLNCFLSTLREVRM